MNKRPFIIFGVVAVIGIILIPFWALSKRGDSSAAAMPIASSDRPAQSLFQTNCGACHTLAAGGTDGVVGPNLDVILGGGPESESAVDANCALVLNYVNNGIGGRMPAGILQGVNAEVVANFVARNLAYVNTSDTPSKSTEVSASQVKCGTASAAAPSKSAAPKKKAPPAKQASAKKKAAAPKKAAATSLNVAANPTGQLKYEQSSLSAEAGNVNVKFANQSPLQHDFCLQEGNKQLGCTSIIQGASTSKTFANLKPGSYTFYCSVDGHEAAGMKGTLTVK